MTQQTPYEPAIQDQPAYGHGAPAYAPGPPKTNTMAILGLIFAFVFSPLGIVFSALGLSQIKKRREGGRGLAIAGLVLSILFLLLSLIVVFFVFAAVTEAAQTAAAEQTAAEQAAAEQTEAAVAPGGDQGVLEACDTIVPAISAFATDMASVTTPEEYALVVTDTRVTIEGAAAGTSDPAFVQEVQLLSDDLQLAADAVTAGEDPTFLMDALIEDEARVTAACTTAGY